MIDISNWPIQDVMMLPDYCFGRRWLVGLTFTLTGPGAVYVLSPAKMPDKFVIWNMTINLRWATSSSILATFGMGEQSPGSALEFDNLPKIFPECETQAGLKGGFEINYLVQTDFPRLKMPVIGSGRYIIGKFVRSVGSSQGGQVCFTVSMLPKAVPEWTLKQ